MAARWWDELTEGLGVDHAVARTITEADNTFVHEATLGANLGFGDVEFERCGDNQNGVVVVRCRRSALMKCKPQSAEQAS